MSEHFCYQTCTFHVNKIGSIASTSWNSTKAKTNMHLLKRENLFLPLTVAGVGLTTHVTRGEVSSDTLAVGSYALLKSLRMIFSNS